MERVGAVFLGRLTLPGHSVANLINDAGPFWYGDDALSLDLHKPGSISYCKVTLSCGAAMRQHLNGR
jgi:hypothetical protein